MTQNKQAGNKRQDLKLTMTLATLALLFSILACSTNLPGNTSQLSPTDVARSVESTLNAEKVATYQAQQTLDASAPVAVSTYDTGISATLQAQQATMDAQATSQIQQITQPVNPATAVSTLQDTPTPQVITLTEWEMTNFSIINSGCMQPDQICWKAYVSKLIGEAGGWDGTVKRDTYISDLVSKEKIFHNTGPGRK
jgi:hypothetical protein